MFEGSSSGANGFEWDAGVNAEAGIGGGVDVEEVGDGGGEGCAVEHAGMAEDVHEQGVGAVAGVEFHPLPVFAGARASGGSVNLGEAAEPGGVGADVFVGVWMKVAVAALFVAAEDDYRVGALGFVVEQVLGLCEMLGADAEIAAQHGGRP